MVPEYSTMVSSLLGALVPMGYELNQNSDFLLVLQRSGRFVVLEGEPFVRGAFNLGITSVWPPSPRHMFSVRLLMRIFGVHDKPSLENQLRFLVTNQEVLFESPEAYESQYRDLDEGGCDSVPVG
jgi:hypothetical protein